MARSAKAKGSAVQAIIQLRPSLEVSDDTPQYYVNHAEINSTVHEFVISAGRLPGRLTQAQIEMVRATSVLPTPADVQLLIPPTLIVGLIRALQTQKDVYEAQYGITLAEYKGEGQT